MVSFELLGKAKKNFHSEGRDRFFGHPYLGFRSRKNTHNASIFLRAGLCLGASLVPSVCGWSLVPGKPSVETARENNIGVALMNQQLLAKALVHFEEAHKADPTSIIPVLNRGLALIYLGRLPEANATLEAASATDPSNARVWYSLGLARFDAGNQQQALVAFRQAAQIDPSNAANRLGACVRN